MCSRLLAIVACYTYCGISFLPGQGVPRDTIHDRLLEIAPLQDISDSLLNSKIVQRKYSSLVIDQDTLVIALIENIQVSAPRSFSSPEDYLKYMKYKRYAASVYPYAKEAIRIFREAEYVTAKLKKRKRKKYLKKLSKELEKEFEDPLKNLSKTQGKILVKMIEKELNQPLFHLIKMTRGRMKAFYWNQFSKLYGYRLKRGYMMGQNPILDIVLQDFDISYEIVEK